MSARSPASARACRLSATRARRSRSCVGRARLQRRAQRPPDQVVQRHPAHARVGERAAREPAQRGRGVGTFEDVHDQRGRDDARDAGEREHVGELPGQRHVGDASQMRPQRRRVRSGRPGPIFARGRRAESQRQWQPARPAGDRFRTRIVLQALALEQRARLVLRERHQRQLDRDRLPAAFEPTRLGRLAAGDHDHGVGRERGEQRRAQIAAERAHVLVAVDQDQRPVRRPRAGQRLLHSVGDRRQVAPVERERNPAGGDAAAADLSQEHALADPTGPVDEHDAGGRVRLEHHVGDQEFAGAADEFGVLAAGDLAGKRAGFSNHRLHRARERSPDTELRPNRY